MLKKLFSYSIAVALIITLTGPAYATDKDKPSAAFFETSWTTMSNLKNWSETCKITISTITIVGQTTPEQKAVLDIFSKAFRLFQKKYTDIYNLTDKLLYSFGEKVDTLTPIGEVGQITNDELTAKINSSNKASGKIILSNNDIYFGEGQMPSWKKFTDSELATSMWTSINESIGQKYEKASFVFSKWGIKKKTAIYNGRVSAEETKSIIKNLFGPGLEEGQQQAKITATINANTKLWDKIQTTATVISGVMKFTIKESCTVTTKASKTKITVPTIFEELDKTTGANELMEFVLKVF